MEYIEKLITYFTDLGVSRGVAIAYLIVTALIAVMAVVALVMRIVVVIKYYKGNHMKTKSGKTSFEVAREALDKAGLQHVQVKKANIFRAFFFGNCYSITKKTIFLRRSIAKKDSITAVGLALQKVGVAKMCEEGDFKARTRSVMSILNVFAPVLFIPVVALGVVIDILLLGTLGIASIISLAVGGFLVLTGFIVTLLNIPVERNANKMALKVIDETKVLDEEEREVVVKVFEAYMIAYVCEFILAVLRIVQYVLEIVMKVQINNKN